MSRWMQKGGQEEMRWKGRSKRRLLQVDKELRKREHKEGQLDDRMTGRGRKWENRRGEERKLIISSSLYKPISDPQSLRQGVLKNITAVTEGPLYSMSCCNYKRIWRPHRAIQSNNYCFTLEVSSSKPVLATNHHFHLLLPNPNIRMNKSQKAALSHVKQGMHVYSNYMSACVCSLTCVCLWGS